MKNITIIILISIWLFNFSCNTPKIEECNYLDSQNLIEFLTTQYRGTPNLKLTKELAFYKNGFDEFSNDSLFSIIGTAFRNAYALQYSRQYQESEEYLDLGIGLVSQIRTNQKLCAESIDTLDYIRFGLLDLKSQNMEKMGNPNTARLIRIESVKNLERLLDSSSFPDEDIKNSLLVNYMNLIFVSMRFKMVEEAEEYIDKVEPYFSDIGIDDIENNPGKVHQKTFFLDLKSKLYLLKNEENILTRVSKLQDDSDFRKSLETSNEAVVLLSALAQLELPPENHLEVQNGLHTAILTNNGIRLTAGMQPEDEMNAMLNPNIMNQLGMNPDFGFAEIREAKKLILFDSLIQKAILKAQSALVSVSTTFKNKKPFRNPRTIDNRAIITQPEHYLTVLYGKADIYWYAFLQSGDGEYLEHSKETYGLATKAWNEIKKYKDIGFDMDAFSGSTLSNLADKVSKNSLEAFLQPTKDNIISIQEYTKTLNYLEGLKGFQLRVSLNTNQLRENVPSWILDREKYFQKELNEIRVSKESQNLIELQTELKIFRDSVEKEMKGYYDLKYDNRTIRLEDIQSFLKEDMAVVEYSLSRTDGFAIIITKDTVFHFEIPGKREWYNEFLAYQDFDNIKNYQKRYGIPYSLYLTLLEPGLGVLSSEFPKINRLIIIPDNELIGFDFEMLPVRDIKVEVNEDNLRLLVDDYAVTVAYSISNVFRKNSPLDEQEVFVGFAPLYNSEDESELMSCSDGKLTEMRGFTNEVFQQYFKNKGGSVFLEANKDEFISNVPNNQIVHMTLHGCAGSEAQANNFLDYYLMFTPSEGNNGILTMREILNTEKNINADLVILGACNSDFGTRVKGEGVFSMATAFQLKGCSSVLASDEVISQTSTVSILRVFYAGLMKGLPKDKALQQAKLAFHHSGKEGDFLKDWYKFNLIGDPSPIPMD